jgi:hypothetical protein
MSRASSTGFTFEEAAEKFGRIEIGSSYGPKLNDDGRRLTCCY